MDESRTHLFADGFMTSRPTKASDYHALGMVIYETISGHPPFHGDRDPTVLMKVSGGEPPCRGVGVRRGSVEDIEAMLDTCDRASAQVSKTFCSV